MVGIKTKIGEKGQIVIPKPIRDKFNLDKNTEVIVDEKGDDIIIRKKKSDLEIYDEYVNEFKNKIKLPDKIDWSKELYSRYEK